MEPKCVSRVLPLVPQWVSTSASIKTLRHRLSVPAAASSSAKEEEDAPTAPIRQAQLLEFFAAPHRFLPKVKRQQPPKRRPAAAS
jgi:hypothetical protein